MLNPVVRHSEITVPAELFPEDSDLAPALNPTSKTSAVSPPLVAPAAPCKQKSLGHLGKAILRHVSYVFGGILTLSGAVGFLPTFFLWNVLGFPTNLLAFMGCAALMGLGILAIWGAKRFFASENEGVECPVEKPKSQPQKTPVYQNHKATAMVTALQPKLSFSRPKA